MAFPTVQSTAESATATAGTNHVVTLPSGIAAGDLILILMDIGSTAATINAHADYSELLDENSANGLKILYRYATGGESNPTFVTSASTRSAEISYRISGAALSGRLPEIGTTATGTSATPNPPAVTPTGGAKDYLFIAFFGMAGEEADDDTWANTPPTDYTPNPPLQKSCGIAGTNLGGLIGAASRQVNASSADPGTFGVDVSAAWRAQTIAIHPVATVTLTVATATLEAVALTPTPGQVTVELAAAAVTLSGVALTPTPQPVNVNLEPATATLAGVTLVATPIVELVSATATLSAVALTPTPGQVTVDLSPAAGSFAGVVLTPVPGEVTVTLTPATATLTAIELDPDPQSVTVTLAPATAIFAAVALTIEGGPNVTLEPATATLVGVALDPQPQPVTVSLGSATATLAAVAVSPSPQPVTVALEPAGAALVGQALSPAPQPVTVALVPATITLGAVALSVGGGVGSVELVPAILTLSAVALGPNPDLSRYHPDGTHKRPGVGNLSKVKPQTRYRRAATMIYRRSP